MGFWDIMMAIITTLVGAFLGWIITIHTTKSKKPLWFCNINPLFQKGVAAIPDLSIKYKNNDVSNLSSVFFAFWNDGKEPITRDTVVEPLRLTVSGSIYEAQVIQSTTASNDLAVTVTDDKTAAELDFKYLDHKQGVVIQIFSDCSNIADFQFVGAIMGCKKFKNFTYKDKRKAKLMGAFSSIISSIIAAFATAVAAFLSNGQGGGRLTAGSNHLMLNAVIAFSLVAILLVSAFAIIKYFRDTRYRMPKEFRKYFNN